MTHVPRAVALMHHARAGDAMDALIAAVYAEDREALLRALEELREVVQDSVAAEREFSE